MNDKRSISMWNWAVSLVFAAICGMIAYTIQRGIDNHPGANNGAAQMFVWIFWIGAVALALIFVVSFVDYASVVFAAGLERINMARTAHLRELAYAFHGLPNSTIEVLMRQDRMEITGLLGAETGPVWTLQMLSRRVDYFFVEAYLKRAEEIKGSVYLMPERDAYDVIGEDGKSWTNAKELATEVTNYLVVNKWAEGGHGTNSAKLIVPIEYVAARLGVGL